MDFCIFYYQIYLQIKKIVKIISNRVRWEEAYEKNFLIIKRCLDAAYHSYPSMFILNIISTLMLGIFSGISVYSMTILVNGIQKVIASGYGIQRPIIVFSIINIILILLSSIRTYSNQKLILKFDFFLDYEFIKKCKQMELKDFETEDTYDLIARASNMGKEKVIQTYTHVLQLTESIVAIISVISIILKFNNLIWVGILIVPFFSTFANMKLGKYSYQIERDNIKNNRQVSYINYLLSNNIAIKEIISFNIGDYLLKKFNVSMEKIINANEKIINKYSVYNFILEILEVFIKLCIVISSLFISIDKKSMIGDVMGFIYSLDLIQGKFKFTLASLSEIYKDKLYIEDFFQLLDKDISNRNSDIQFKESIKNISIKNLSFSYKENEKILKAVNIEFEVNKPVAIVGVNGSGKSTLIKILAGLYQNYEGNIMVNGMNIKEFNIDSYREKIGVIFQDYNKYEMNLRENIAFSNVDAIYDDDLLKNTLNIVGMSYILDKFKDGLDTQMGHWFGGEDLSKGQWQRIALARMLVRDADVIILDEPTSALDPIVECEIFDLINKLAKDKILILITHRIGNLLKYDPWFVIIEDGEIVLQGRKEDINNEKKFIRLINKIKI